MKHNKNQSLGIDIKLSSGGRKMTQLGSGLNQVKSQQFSSTLRGSQFQHLIDLEQKHYPKTARHSKSQSYQPTQMFLNKMGLVYSS